jgi:hypothetical protein
MSQGTIIKTLQKTHILLFSSHIFLKILSFVFSEAEGGFVGVTMDLSHGYPSVLTLHVKQDLSGDGCMRTNAI